MKLLDGMTRALEETTAALELAQGRATAQEPPSAAKRMHFMRGCLWWNRYADLQEPLAIAIYTSLGFGFLGSCMFLKGKDNILPYSNLQEPKNPEPKVVQITIQSGRLSLF